MKIIKFVYDKKDGSKPKERTFLSLLEPFQDYAGYDLNELSAEELRAFESQIEFLRNQFAQVILDFDLAAAYRRFKPDKMTFLDYP